MYTLEMAYARMRELQDQANRSRTHRSAVAHRADKVHAPRTPKKR